MAIVHEHLTACPSPEDADLVVYFEANRDQLRRVFARVELAETLDPIRETWDRVEAARLADGLSLNALGQLLGAKYMSFDRWRDGTGSPSTKLLLRAWRWLSARNPGETAPGAGPVDAGSTSGRSG